VKLTFLGTRGALNAPGNGHHKHSALLVEHDGTRLLVDCGSDHLGLLARLQPDAVLLTHAHDDHVGGLDAACPCPVWASNETWEILADLELPRRCTFAPRETFRIGALSVTPWPVVHSFRAPAVAFRIEGGLRTLFYAPDIAALPAAGQVLAGVDLYVGDGAAFDSSMQRIEQGQLCGHAPLPEQLAWCVEAGVPRLFVTHCGETLCGAQAASWLAEFQVLGSKAGVTITVAVDGEELEL